MELDNIGIVVGPLLSLIITFLGLFLSHRYEMKRLAVEDRKAKEEAKRIDAEASKLEAEKDKIVLEGGVAQLAYFSSAMDNMRKELEFQSNRGRENSDRIALFEAKLIEADQEKKVLAEENKRLKDQVESQEIKILSQEAEITELRGKIEIIERKNSG